MFNKVLFSFILTFLFIQNLHAEEWITPPSPDFKWATSVELGYLFPLDYYQYLLNSAPFVTLKASYHPPEIDDVLFNAEAGFAFSNFKNAGSVNYYFIPLGLGAAYRFPVWEDFWVLPSIGGGFYFLNIQDSSFRNFYSRIGFQTRYRWTYHFHTSLDINQYYLHDPQKGLWALNASLGVHYIFGNPYAEKDLKVVDLSMERIFAALYPLYYKKPLGAIRIQNTSPNPIKDISVSFYIKDYMDHKTVSRIKRPILKKDQTAVFPVYAFFSEEIKKLASDVQTTGTLEIEYVKVDGKSYRKQHSVDLKIFHKNALVWDQLNKLGSFVSYNDPAIIEFTRKILALPMDTSSPLPEDLTSVLKFVTALQLYHLQYVKDPGTPYKTFSYQTSMVDYIQYPRETLLTRTGDCDDLSVLLAAMLESVGIRTAFITQPGHIFLLIEAQGVNSPNTVAFQDKKWIPLETTRLQEGFHNAWTTGFSNYNSGKIETIRTVFEAVNEFPPIQFKTPLSIPFSIDQKRFNQIIEKQNLVLSKKSIPDEDHSRLGPEEMNQRGIQHARRKEYGKAEEFFKSSIRKNPEYKIPYYNLMSLYGLTGNHEKAGLLFREFKTHFPGDERMEKIIEKFNLHKIQSPRENLKTLRRSF
jgi:hypothetical protein